MDVASTFMPLLQVFFVAMSEPTFVSFRELVAGWIFAPRRTISGMLRAGETSKHHSAYHRIFAAASWSIDVVGLSIFDLVVRLAPQSTYYLAGDDTTIARTGLKVFGAGMHRDACLSSRGFTVTRWGHCWVVLAVVIPSRTDPHRRFAIPVLARLYLNQKTSERLRRKHRKKTDLMIEMLRILNAHAPGKSLHFLGDSAYTGPRMLSQLPESIAVTGRLGLNARLCDAPPERTGKRGRPRRRGARLPSPAELIQQKGLRRLKLSLYQQTTQSVRVATQLGRMYLAPEREVLVVVVEHLRGGRGVEVFYTTEFVDRSAEDVLRTYSWRWTIETTFQESKQHLGVGEPQNRTRKAARRTAATGFYLYGLIVLWHEYVRDEPRLLVRIWRGKRHASFSDMLAALRHDSLEEIKAKHFSAPGDLRLVQKILKPLEQLLLLAT